MAIFKNLIDNIISFKRTHFPHKKKMSKLIFTKNYDTKIEEYSAPLNPNVTITYTLHTTLDKNKYLDVFISHKDSIILFENHIIDKNQSEISIFFKIRDSISEALFLYSYYYEKYDEAHLDFIGLASKKLMEYKSLTKDKFPDNISYYYTELFPNNKSYFIFKNNKTINETDSKYDFFEILNIHNQPVLKDQNDYISINRLYNPTGHYYYDLNIIKTISKELKEETFDCVFEFLVFSDVIRLTIHHDYINNNPNPPKDFILDFIIDNNFIKIFDNESNLINQIKNTNNLIRKQYNDGRTFLRSIDENEEFSNYLADIIKTECYKNFVKNKILEELEFKIPLRESEMEYIKMIDY